MSKQVAFVWDEPDGCSTPRGWVRISAATHPDRKHPHFGYGRECNLLGCGNYLDYGPTSSRGPNGETVHAVAYANRMHNPHLSVVSEANIGWQWFTSIQDAKEWIERRVLEHLASSL